jgi:hypothetical protein
LFLPLSGQSQKSVFRRDLLVGSWKADWSKSKVQTTDSTLPNLYRRYEDYGDGLMLHVIILVDPGQTQAQVMAIAAVKYDGKEYPVYSGKDLADRLATGTQPAQTVSFRVVDAYNMVWTDRANGKITGTGTVALSADGKTMTDRNTVFDADGKQTAAGVLVFVRQ